MNFDLDAFLPYRLAVAATRVSRRFAARYAAEAGLSIPEWQVLAHLSRSGAVSVRDITVRVTLDKSIVTSITFAQKSPAAGLRLRLEARETVLRRSMERVATRLVIPVTRIPSQKDHENDAEPECRK